VQGGHLYHERKEVVYDLHHSGGLPGALKRPINGTQFVTMDSLVKSARRKIEQATTFRHEFAGFVFCCRPQGVTWPRTHIP